MKRRHPPFRGTSGGGWKRGADYCSKAGAHSLASMIQAAWTASGHDIVVEVVPVPLVRDEMVYAVRMPGLINGLPVRRETIP